ncbi:hypothetical protein HDU76_011461 [Blyttiomyces sp. JEL0837]|nr:hypothetical protein HDU76_011461 [Blyttiomyces sp. JEL0837]
MATLYKQKYGKDKVRLVKSSLLPTDPQAPGLKRHHVSELTCRVLLFGPAFEPSYSQADNSLVVPTDTVKNTIYYLAKKSPETLETIELFAHTIATHFLSKYAHVEGVDIHIQSHNWTRVSTTTLTPVSATYSGTSVTGRGDSNFGANTGTPVFEHPHSFYRGGEEKRITHVVAERVPNSSNVRFTIKSGLTDLLVLKSTGSSFEAFHRDNLTTLPDMSDRIFSTSVECFWGFAPFIETTPTSVVLDHSANAKAGSLSAVPFDSIFRGTRQITIDLFANHDSPSVQNTLYRMGEVSLAAFPDIFEIEYALPNKHVFGYDLDRFGEKNTGANMNVYYPVADPSGLITATIRRKSAKL